MRAGRRVWSFTFTILVASTGFWGAQAACEGNTCPEESRDARAAGLLGSPSVQQCSKTKDYPNDGTKLKPVRSFDILLC